MYSGLTTRRVLVMEWIDGDRIEGRDAETLRLVEIGVQCSLQQVTW